MAQVEKVDLQNQTGTDRTCVWETDHIQIMRIRLSPGEALPHHNSNSNVLLLPLAGGCTWRRRESMRCSPSARR